MDIKRNRGDLRAIPELPESEERESCHQCNDSGFACSARCKGSRERLKEELVRESKKREATREHLIAAEETHDSRIPSASEVHDYIELMREDLRHDRRAN